MKQIETEKAFALYKPEVCSFIISVDKTGKPSGMVAGWNMKCSLNPPCFAVSISKSAYTYTLIQESKEFVVAVGNKKMEEAVLFFWENHGNKVDKFRKTGIKTRKSQFIQAPILEDASLNFECKLLKKIDVGDHTIFIGEVLCAYENNGEKVLIDMRRKNGARVFKEV